MVERGGRSCQWGEEPENHGEREGQLGRGERREPTGREEERAKRERGGETHWGERRKEPMGRKRKGEREPMGRKRKRERANGERGGESTPGHREAL